MPDQCENEGCDAEAVYMTMIRTAPQAGPVSFSKRCETHKNTRPEGTVAQIQVLPPEEE